MFVTLRKKIGPLGMKAMSFKFFKILVSSLLMGVIAHISYRYLENFAGSNISNHNINHRRCIDILCDYLFYENRGCGSFGKTV